MQPPMLRVCYALLPLTVVSIYLFGWRSLALIALSFLFGIATEAIFAFREGKPVTSAVFVTCLIFSLSLPPTLPLWMAVVGIVVGVGLGKMAFGGLGQNVFNPAMVGRCFIYITFPVQMSNIWIRPMWDGLAGFASFTPPVEAVTQATPLMEMKNGLTIPLKHLFMGNVAGSLGETSAVLIIIGGIYIIYKKAAPWRLALSCLTGGIFMSIILNVLGISAVLSPLETLLAGSFLFGTAFVVTEPVSGAKTRAGQWLYGFIVGGLTVLLRSYSNFSEGFMFSILLMNAFVPMIDQAFQRIEASRKGAL